MGAPRFGSFWGERAVIAFWFADCEQPQARGGQFAHRAASHAAFTGSSTSCGKAAGHALTKPGPRRAGSMRANAFPRFTISTVSPRSSQADIFPD